MAEPSAPQRAPGILLVVLIAAMAAGVTYNFGATAVSAPLIAEFGITDGQFGLIPTVAFLAAAVGAAFSGMLTDRLKPGTQIGSIMLGAVAAFGVTIIWRSFAGFLVAATLAGLTQAISNPATNRVIAAQVPVAQRAQWMGWKQSGIQMGMLVAGLSFPVLLALGGWTLAAATMCVLLLAGFALAWVVFERRHPAERARPARSEAPRHREPLPTSVWLYCAISFLNAVGTGGVNSYLTLFAVRELGFAVELGGLMLGIIGTAGILSRVGWGRVNGAWGEPARLIGVMNLGGLSALAALSFAALTGQVWLLWVGVALHAGLPLAANVVINSGIIAAAPAARVGSASGRVAAAMYTGFAAGPALMGVLLDVTGEFNAAWLAVAGTFVLCFVLAVILAAVLRREACS